MVSTYSTKCSWKTQRAFPPEEATPGNILLTHGDSRMTDQKQTPVKLARCVWCGGHGFSHSLMWWQPKHPTVNTVCAMHMHLPFIYIHAPIERTTLSTDYTQVSDAKIMTKCMSYMSMYIYQHLYHMVFIIFPKNRLYSSKALTPHFTKIPCELSVIYKFQQVTCYILNQFNAIIYHQYFCLCLSQICI